MSDVEISRAESLTRHEAARRLSALADALAAGGRVEVELGASTLKLGTTVGARSWGADQAGSTDR